MIISFSSPFKKNYKKIPKEIQSKFDETLVIFSKNIFDERLRNHKIHHPWIGCRSIDVTGSIRAIYEERENEAHFVALDNHANLYK